MSEQEIAHVMEEMPYGLYIIGSNQDGEVNGMMADWVMQVSFNPRLVAVALENDAHTLENIRKTGAFTVNFLPQDHRGMEVAAKFAQPYYDAKVKERNHTAAVAVHRKLEGIPYAVTADGCPTLEAATAWLECHAEQFVPTGDHTLVIAHVENGKSVLDAEPLTSSYTGWNYSG